MMTRALLTRRSWPPARRLLPNRPARSTPDAWLTANKADVLLKTDCKSGSSTDGIDFKLSCEDKVSKTGPGTLTETAIFEAKELGEDF